MKKIKRFTIIIFKRCNSIPDQNNKFLYDLSVMAYKNNNDPEFIFSNEIKLNGYNELIRYCQDKVFRFYNICLEDISTLHFIEV